MKKSIFFIFFFLSCSMPQDCEEPLNIWFRINNDPNSESYGKTMKIDMSKGYAVIDEYAIYLLVLDKDTGEKLVLSFPYGYWETNTKIEEEFKSLEDYLKKNSGIKIEKTY